MVFRKKIDFGWYDFTTRSPLFSSHNAGEIAVKMYLSDFEYLYPSRRYSPSNLKVVRSRAKFCMFLARNIFLGKALEILDLHYLIEHTLHHRAKFLRWPTNLGDLIKIN